MKAELSSHSPLESTRNDRKKNIFDLFVQAASEQVGEIDFLAFSQQAQNIHFVKRGMYGEANFDQAVNVNDPCKINSKTHNFFRLSLQMLCAIRRTHEAQRSLNSLQIESLLLLVIGQCEIMLDDEKLTIFSDGKYQLNNLYRANHLVDLYFADITNPKNGGFAVEKLQQPEHFTAMRYCLNYFFCLRNAIHKQNCFQQNTLRQDIDRLKHINIKNVKAIFEYVTSI